MLDSHAFINRNRMVDTRMKKKKLGTSDFGEHRNPSDLEEYAEIQEEMRRLRLKK